MAQPYLPNYDLLQSLFPTVDVDGKKGRKKTYVSVLQSIRVLDEQNHLSRFSWFVEHYYGLDPDLMERILYYRGTAILWFNKDLEKFMFTPFVGQGLDVYGRYTRCTPLPFTGSTSNSEDESRPYIPGLELTPIYDTNLEELSADELSTKCVIFYDYSKQLANKPIPRQVLNEPICRVIAECIPFTRTSVINNLGVIGYRVQDQSEVKSVDDANDAVVDAAISGKRWVAMKNDIPGVELPGGVVGSNRISDTLMVMEAFDNFRLSTHGIDNGGVFKKKAHMLESEQALNNQDSASVITNCLWNRRHSCELAMSLFELPMWVEISQGLSGFDRDMDYTLDTDQDGPIEYDDGAKINTIQGEGEE